MEVLYGSAGSPGKPEQQTNRDTAIISFAGAFSGGPNNAHYERVLGNQFGSDSVFAIPSVSTKYAFRETHLTRSSFKNNAYYQELAEKTIQRFPDKGVYLIHCQSGGGIEGVAFTRSLLENDKLPAKTIKLFFTGVPGFTETHTNALGRTMQFLQRFIDTVVNRAEYQQEDLCPPPEEYYVYKKQHSAPKSDIQSDTVVAFHDTPEERKKRRETFYSTSLSFLPETEKIKIAKQITRFDTAIISSINAPDIHTSQKLQKLIRQRARIVFSVGGDRYYNDYLAQKPEYKTVRNHGFDGTAVGALYLLRLITSVANGMENQLKTIIRLAEQKNKNIEISFGLFEKDKLMSTDNIPTMRSRLDRAHILDYATNWLFIEGLSHESVDNSPQGVCRALLTLSQSMT